MDGNSPGSGNDTESTLDAEVAGAIAPGAQIMYYQAADTTFQSGVMLAILRAIDDNAVNILNVSYGACELSQGAAGNQAILNAWEQAAAQGIAVTVSSGDSGAAGCDDPDMQMAAARGFGVNALASTPYTVAVGGTDFNVLLNHFSNIRQRDQQRQLHFSAELYSRGDVEQLAGEQRKRGEQSGECGLQREYEHRGGRRRGEQRWTLRRYRQCAGRLCQAGHGSNSTK